LTGEGEQLLTGCRVLLNCASSVKEQAELLRHGDKGVLKIAGSPQHIESVLSQFLHRYAERYPNVQVKVTEGTGSEILTLLERGSAARLGSPARGPTGRRPVQSASTWIGGIACSLPSGHGAGRHRTIEVADLAGFPLLLMDSGFRSAARSMRQAGWRD
jgi:LysR family nitrogen assimilation transcriptional regulator